MIFFFKFVMSLRVYRVIPFNINHIYVIIYSTVFVLGHLQDGGEVKSNKIFVFPLFRILSTFGIRLVDVLRVFYRIPERITMSFSTLC